MRGNRALGRRQLGKLFAQLRGQIREVGQTRAFLLHNGSRSARNEAFVAELGVALGDFAVDAFDFLGEADAFSGHVNFNLEHQLEIANDGNRSD